MTHYAVINKNFGYISGYLRSRLERGLGYGVCIRE